MFPNQLTNDEKILRKLISLKFFTLFSSSKINNRHKILGKIIPKKIANKPSERNQTMECICNINQYCELCERVGERANPNMEGRS